MTEQRIQSAAELSKLSGVDPATLSRVRSGTQQISHEDLDKISAAMGASPLIHSRLLAARLREELRPPGGKRVEINLIGYEQPQPRAVLPGPRLTPKNQRILDILAANMNDTDLRNILASLASLCEKGSLTAPAGRPSSTPDDTNIVETVKKSYPTRRGIPPQK